jgi:K+-sensing histidine kinase KdpD/ActR/RegA family two-component response regulator
VTQTVDPAALVLVVDDDAGMRETVVEILDGVGIRAVGAGTASSALDVSRANRVAVAVVDHRLPDETGVDLARRLLDDDPDRRVLLLTGYATLESAIAAVGRIDDYLVKPVPPDQLVRAVRLALERWRLVAERRELLARLQQSNASLEESDRLRRRELDGLRSASEALAAVASLTDVVSASVESARSATGARAVALYLTDESGLGLQRTAGEAWDMAVVLDPPTSAVEHRQLGQPALDSIVLPLRSGGADVGAIVFGAPSDSSEGFLRTLAAKFALAVQNAQRFERERETVKQLSELSRMKSTFLATVSHELRTPLTVVMGFAQTLLRRGDRVTPEQRVELLERIASQSARLSRLVDDLIDATGVESGLLRVSVEPVDVAAIVARVAEGFLDTDREIVAEVETALPAAYADDVRLEQVMVNLVENARKYSTPGRPIRVNAWSEDGEVCLAVVDEGIGIDPAFAARMFEPFTQADEGDTRRDRGVGLGLAIVRGLVVAMNGTVAAVSEPGVGTTFTVRLGQVEDAAPVAVEP